MSSRDMPAMRTMTWIPDVRSGWEWRHFDEWIAMLGSGTIGTIGFDLMTAPLFESVERSLAGKFTLAAGDAIAATARGTHRPREISIIRTGASVAGAAAAAFLAAWDGGADIESAALGGERMARDLAAQDVRTLVSRNGGRSLQPYRARFDDRPAKLVGYVAVKYLGYWAEVFVSSGAGAAAAAARNSLTSMLSQVHPDVPLDRLAAAAMAKLADWHPHPALGGSFGHRIGLSPCEGERIAEGVAGTIRPGTTYALRAGACNADIGGAIASAMVVMGPDGKMEILARSPEPDTIVLRRP
jgi:Xaa-Pro aminopeptidase